MSADDAELAYLTSPRAIRERAEALYARAASGGLEHWSIDEGRLDDVAGRVARATLSRYPGGRAIPPHSRWRHFDVGGVGRVRALDERLARLAPEDALAARFDLVIPSVLLDAGVGGAWRYRDAGGQEHGRSEGIALASYDLFVEGFFSDRGARGPLRADAAALEGMTSASLERALQVTADNPMIGLEGRASLLRGLGAAARAAPGWGGRLGGLGVALRRSAREGTLPASAVFEAVLDAFGGIWPGRERLAGRPLGDVWRHPAVGRVPFHKLSQWLAYSLFEPLERAGVTVVEQSELTGLAEYRNGGLFVDGGVLVPKHDRVLADEHDVSSEVVVEWRALTVALLDRTAERVRGLLGASARELSLAQVLEGGTWRAGREIAAERRAGGGSPLRVRSDGTVF